MAPSHGVAHAYLKAHLGRQVVGRLGLFAMGSSELVTEVLMHPLVGWWRT